MFENSSGGNRVSYQNGDVAISIDNDLSYVILEQRDMRITLNKEQMIGTIVIFREMIERLKKC